MKNFLIIISILFLINVCSAKPKRNSITFKQTSINIIENELSDSLLDCYSFKDRYKEKTLQAAIEYIAWSPKDTYLAVCVSQIYTGGCDDIWVVSLKDKNIYCITSIFPADSESFGRPVWMNDNIITYSIPNYNIVYDVDSHKLISKEWANEKTNPSNYSLDGEFRSEIRESLLISIFNKADQELITIGEGGGSIIGYAFSTNSNYFIADQFMGHGDDRMILVNLKTLSTYLLYIPFSLRSEIKGTSNWYPDKNMFYLLNEMDGTLHLFDISNKSERTYLLHDYSILEAAWSSGRKKLALVIRDKKSRHSSIRVFNNPVKD